MIGNRLEAVHTGGPNEGGGKKIYSLGASRFEVDEQYEPHSLIGYGAYGAVCSAVNTTTGQKVAIKKIGRVFEDLVDGKRILREVKLLAFLRHQNILSLKDIFRPKDPERFDEVYIVTEFMDTDLHTVIRSKQRLCDDHVNHLVYQLLCGLHYIHSAGVLHRDLKPSNLLTNPHCDLRLCDFGLARGLGEVMTDYVVTRWYRPPELLLLCQTYDYAVDMWGVGCLAVELMTRQALFPGRDYIHQLNLITDVLGTPKAEDLVAVKSDDALRYIQSMPRKRPALPAAYCGTTSPQFIDFVTKILQIDPKKRLSAAGAMQHPYFAERFNASDLIEAPTKFRWEFDDSEMSEKTLRSGFWAEILSFHKS
jgi:serine/threonine protein kinase